MRGGVSPTRGAETFGRINMFKMRGSEMEGVGHAEVLGPEHSYINILPRRLSYKTMILSREFIASRCHIWQDDSSVYRHLQ